MLERFRGQEGRRRLVEVVANQEIVLHNLPLAGQLSDVIKLKEYKKDQEVYLQGQPGNNKLYLILSGRFDLFIRDTHVRILGSGQAVGEFPILDPSLSYTVTIRAREDGVIATILEHELLALADQYPEIWKNMAKMLAARLHATASKLAAIPQPPCVFVGHGHSALWSRVQHFLKDKCGIEAVSFESEPHAGESIVPVLERFLAKATFAVLVLTGEDETARGDKRARQNVVHEAGLFQGVLGFQRAILLVQQGLEEFSNVHGLQYLGFEGDKIESTFAELERVLRREKQIP